MLTETERVQLPITTLNKTFDDNYRHLVSDFIVFTASLDLNRKILPPIYPATTIKNYLAKYFYNLLNYIEEFGLLIANQILFSDQ